MVTNNVSVVNATELYLKMVKMEVSQTENDKYDITYM